VKSPAAGLLISASISVSSLDQSRSFKKLVGPKGFTNTFHEFDLREGADIGVLRCSARKGNFENHCEFVKIDHPASLPGNGTANRCSRLRLVLNRSQTNRPKLSSGWSSILPKPATN
jgi:hypothetical protein